MTGDGDGGVGGVGGGSGEGGSSNGGNGLQTTDQHTIMVWMNIMNVAVFVVVCLACTYGVGRYVMLVL